MLRKKGKTLKENSNAVKGFALLFLRQEEAFSWWGMISRIGLNGKNWEREICFFFFLYIYIFMNQMIFETRERLGRSLHISCMIIIYIYICTRQGPRPVGPWTLALRYNTWPCPVGPMALIRTHLEAQFEHKNHNGTIMSWTSKASPSRSTLTWSGVWLFGDTRSWQPGIALGNIADEWSFGGRNQFQCHYRRSQQNIHLEMMELDLHPHEWDREVIITPPLTSSYK